MLQAPERSVAHLFAAVSPAVAMVLRALEAFDIKKHARWPKGHPSAGKFRPMPDLLKKALRDFDGEGHPFDSFSRDQLMRAAKAMDISLGRGESRDSIAGKVFAKLDPKGNFRHDLDEIQAKQKPSVARQSGSRTAAEMIEDPEPEDRGRLTELLSGMTLPQIKEFAAEHDTKVMPFGTKADKVAGLVETLVGMRINLLAHGLGTKSDGSPDDFVPPWKKASVSSPADAVRQRELRTAELQKGGGLEGAGATDRLASVFHENWRASRAQPDGGFEPRVKTTKDAKWKAKHGTDQVDIANTPFEDLPEDWQAENRAAAKVVVDLMRTRGGNLSREEAGAAIHDAWLERNDWARGGDLDVPFAKLPKDEQDKDVEQYDAAVKLFGGGNSDGLDGLTDPQPAARAASASGDVRGAVGDLADKPGGWVRLSELRKQLAAKGYTAPEQDAALKELANSGDAQFIPVANLKSLSPEDRQGAVKVGGELKHLIKIDGVGGSKKLTDVEGAKPARTRAPKAAAAEMATGGRTAAQMIADPQAGDREAMRELLKPMTLTQLGDFARAHGAELEKAGDKEQRRNRLVEWLIGGQLDRKAIQSGIKSDSERDWQKLSAGMTGVPGQAQGGSRAGLKVAAADAIANPTGPMPADDVLNTMTIKQLKDFHEQRTGSKLSGVTRKADIVAAVRAADGPKA